MVRISLPVIKEPPKLLTGVGLHGKNVFAGMAAMKVEAIAVQGVALSPDTVGFVPPVTRNPVSPL